jgi:hypothetical protein
MGAKCCSISACCLILISDMKHILSIAIILVLPFQAFSQDIWPSLNYRDVAKEKPGLLFVSSLAIPGLGQAVNDQWWKTALFGAVEITAIALMVDYKTRAKTGMRRTYRYGDNNWSVVNYAEWLHGYYHDVGRKPGSPNVPITQLLTPEGLAVYNSTGQFPTPNFVNAVDWSMIDINALRALEKNSIFLTTGREFSHTLPDYGSQQYYELMSKYPQFGAGWRDWNNSMNDLNQGVNGMSPMFFWHGDMSENFNDLFRNGDNMAMLLITNHVISAFDAYFTIKIRNARLEQSAFLYPGGGEVRLRLSF